MIIRKELFKEEEGEQADGCCPVVITINHNGKSRRVGISLYVKESAWNQTDALINDRERDYLVKKRNQLLNPSTGGSPELYSLLLIENLTSHLTNCSNHSSMRRFAAQITNLPEQSMILPVHKDSELCFCSSCRQKADASVRIIRAEDMGIQEVCGKTFWQGRK